jgi:hypothetical protein
MENVQNKLKLVMPWLRQLAAQPSLCGICGGQSGPETGFPPVILHFCSQYHFTNTPNLFVCHQSYLPVTNGGIIKHHA